MPDEFCKDKKSRSTMFWLSKELKKQGYSSAETEDYIAVDNEGKHICNAYNKHITKFYDKEIPNNFLTSGEDVTNPERFLNQAFAEINRANNFESIFEEKKGNIKRKVDDRIQYLEEKSITDYEKTKSAVRRLIDKRKRNSEEPLLSRID